MIIKAKYYTEDRKWVDAAETSEASGLIELLLTVLFTDSFGLEGDSIAVWNQMEKKRLVIECSTKELELIMRLITTMALMGDSHRLSKLIGTHGYAYLKKEQQPVVLLWKLAKAVVEKLKIFKTAILMELLGKKIERHKEFDRFTADQMLVMLQLMRFENLTVDEVLTLAA